MCTDLREGENSTEEEYKLLMEGISALGKGIIHTVGAALRL